MTPLVVYPNVRGKDRNEHREERRGALRIGKVENNTRMMAQGLTDLPASVIFEEHGDVCFYVWSMVPGDDQHPDCYMWVGPYWALSEEIVAES